MEDGVEHHDCEEEAWRERDTDPATVGREDEEDLANDEEHEVDGAHLAQDDGTRGASVGNCPADEVGMRLITEALLREILNRGESCRVSGVL